MAIRGIRMLQLKSECATPRFTATRKSPSTIRALSATPVSRQLVAHRRIRPENPLRWMQTVCIGTGSASVVRKKELRSSKLRVTAPAPTIERYDFLVSFTTRHRCFVQISFLQLQRQHWQIRKLSFNGALHSTHSADCTYEGLGL